MKIPRDAEEALQPLRDYFNTRGNKTELARQIAEETGRNITRQTVDRWLASNADSRKQEPGLTVGLVLIRIGNAIMMNEEWKRPVMAEQINQQWKQGPNKTNETTTTT